MNVVVKTLCADLIPSLFLLGNNVLRTIHGVGEMMTQMVMSRGVLQSLPDTPPSLRYGKAHFMQDNEDVMVMDTKLKIIEILQVSNILLITWC